MSSSEKEALTKSYELIVLHLCKLQDMNPSLTANFEIDDNKCLQHFFFCPGWINKIICAIRPVISLDCAHLKTIHKGGLYIFGVLDGDNNIFLLAFGVAAGTENQDNWD